MPLESATKNLQVIAVLALRIRPEKEFTDILQLGRIGETGETYAVNKDGLMISNSRFDESLILLGLLPDQDAATSILNIQVRDPGGNTAAGYRPTVRRRELPLTKICAATVSGGSGVMMDSYRDYRGESSFGAYTWLPQYQLGIITEVDVSEFYHPLMILQRCFYVLYTMLALGALAIFVFTLVISRLRRQARKSAVEAKQLGQYRLEEKIGAGAMGVVYKGQHAMLRRPTAIKMLDVQRVNEASIQRFEREVQITCKLNNPHTVAIYDYGRTPEGVFYYAMEFLDGVNLQTLVEQDGPQPEGRVVSILRQVCASLYEAHSLGLVHRDIKPANIMLNRRGAEPDVVKVLDFGLVKAADDAKEGAGGAMSGTPLYMSPESIQTPESVDACSDLYAVGAVGYFLLTGQTAFNAASLGELCQQHLTAIPDAPSQRLGRAISAELEHAILACLEKNAPSGRKPRATWPPCLAAFHRSGHSTMPKPGGVGTNAASKLLPRVALRLPLLPARPTLRNQPAPSEGEQSHQISTARSFLMRPKRIVTNELLRGPLPLFVRRIEYNQHGAVDYRRRRVCFQLDFAFEFKIALGAPSLGLPGAFVDFKRPMNRLGRHMLGHEVHARPW